jgi:hypothetical protein
LTSVSVSSLESGLVVDPVPWHVQSVSTAIIRMQLTFSAGTENWKAPLTHDGRDTYVHDGTDGFVPAPGCTGCRDEAATTSTRRRAMPLRPSWQAAHRLDAEE